jgi:hypothetical protein
VGDNGGESLVVDSLSARQRVVAASLLRRRPELVAGALTIAELEECRFWFGQVCDEIQRLAIVDQRQIQAFFDRAGVPADQALTRSVTPANAA